MFCPNCGHQNIDTAVFCQSCGQDLKAPSSIALSKYAGFWKRFAAFLVDFLIVGVISAVLSAVTLGIGAISIFFLPWIYEAYMTSSEKRATFGKMMMHIIVTGPRGEQISFVRATGRHFAKWISCFILGIGFVMAAFTEKKQALHDMIADTLVVDQ